MNKTFIVALLLIVTAAFAQTTPGRVWSTFKIDATSGKLPLTSGSFFGASVANIGDINNDGVADLAVGATEQGLGVVFIVLLKADQTVQSWVKIYKSTTLPLVAGDSFGSSVAGIGDFDGDGVRDLIVGAPGDNSNGSRFGACYIICLKSDGNMKSNLKITSTTAGFSAGDFMANDNFGYSLTSLGDYNADGFTEIAVGANGYNNFTGSFWLLSLNKSGTIVAKKRVSAIADLAVYDAFGSSLAAIDDLDGDGVRDLIVGAPLGEESADNSTGAIYLLNLNKDLTVKGYSKIGKSSPLLSNQLDNFDCFGMAVCSLGDIDKNGTPDIAVGAYGDDDGAEAAGAAFVLLMGSNAGLQQVQKISSSAGALGYNLAANSQFGSALAALDDLDNNGVPGFVCGIPNLSSPQVNQGEVHLINLYGNATTDSATSIKTDRALVYGTVNPNGISSVVNFEYGLTKSYGLVSSSKSINGSTDQQVSLELSALQSGKLYYYRIKSTNSRGYTYGQERTFSTLNAAPVITQKLPVDSAITIKKGTQLDFSITVTDAENDPLSYKWFKDKSVQVSQLKDLSLTFGEVGQFAIKAKVSDAQSADSTGWMITVVDPSSVAENLPKTTQLYQNYPNPFNPETQIGFDLAGATAVEIAIYNHKGEFVQTLIKDFRKAGRYSVAFNGNQLASGIYFCKMKTSTYSRVSKMMMIK